MKKTRKIISLLLSLLMIITSVPLMAVESFAADTVQSGTTGECTWTLDSDGVLTISGNSYMRGYDWSNHAPWGTSITKVVIKDGVTSIGDYAFIDCTSLTSINIPDSVTSIGSSAFSDCTSLTSVTIGNGVTEIGGTAFSDCTSLTSINIPDSVTSIGGGTFWGCTSLTSVTIPDSVTSIDGNAFQNCTSLASVTIGNGVTSIGWNAFSGCTSLTNITIGNGVTSIGFQAFSGCTSLTSITIPDSVTSIDTSAFADTAYYNDESNWNNGLLYIGNHLIEAKEDVSGNVEIKQGTKTVASCAFLNCSSLKSITIPESVTAIGWGAFGCDEEGNPICDFKIYGTVGSEAERYADDNCLEFISIDGTPVKSFPDVTREDWYYSAVKYNSRNSYITGYSNGTFGPANNIQRQDFVLILARIAGADLSAYEGQNGGFSDVQTGSYYASAVAWAKDTGVANGFSADNFGVGTFISREQICIMLCRYLNGSASGNADTILNAYPDGGNTSPWAKAGVAWAVENGIIGNSDYLNPNGNAGRAEVAQIIYNMSNNGIL